MIRNVRKVFLVLLCGIFQTAILFAGPFSSPKKTASSKNQSAVNSISKKEISRIVSLGPSATEIIFVLGAGDRLVARTDFCDFPPEAKNVKSIGGFDAKTFSLESIVALEPDFVYLFAGMHSHLIKPLRDLGIKVYASDCTSIDDVKKEIREVGSILQKQEKAKELISDIDEKLSKAEKIIKDKKGKIHWNKMDSAPTELIPYPDVYFEINSTPYMSVAKCSFINDILLKAGCKNIFADEKSAYPVVSEEAIIYKNPDIIIFPSYYESQKDILDFIKLRPQWKNINAVIERRIIVLDSEIFDRPGPRVGDAVLELAEKVWSYKTVNYSGKE